MDFRVEKKVCEESFFCRELRVFDDKEIVSNKGDQGTAAEMRFFFG